MYIENPNIIKRVYNIPVEDNNLSSQLFLTESNEWYLYKSTIYNKMGIEQINKNLYCLNENRIMGRYIEDTKIFGYIGITLIHCYTVDIQDYLEYIL